MSDNSVTEYKFVGNETDIISLRNNIIESVSVDRKPNSRGKMWIGNVLEYNGIDGYGGGYVSCGEITSIREIVQERKQKVYSFKISTSEPDIVTHKAFQTVLDMKYQSVNMYWANYNERSGLYITNDKDKEHFKYQYIAYMKYDNRVYVKLFDKWHTSKMLKYVNECLTDSGVDKMSNLYDALTMGVEWSRSGNGNKLAINMTSVYY